MNDVSFTFFSAGEEDTERLGLALAESLPAGMTVALVGTLGAGKTRLVRAVARGLGIDPREVVSPTFVLVQEYHGRLRVYHLDAYRLRDEDEFESLGTDEFFGDGESLAFVEWADRVARCLPSDRLTISIEPTGEETRTITIAAAGPRSAEAALQLRDRLRGAPF